MNPKTQQCLGALVRKLNSDSAPLTEAQEAAILALPAIVKVVKAGHDIVREGDVPSQSCLIVDGLVCRYKMVGDGGKQIQSYHISGDIPDLQSLHLPRMDHSIGVLRESTLAFIPHASLRQLIAAHPDLGSALWRESLNDGSIVREWLGNIGRRRATSRIAHVLCELIVRFRVLGMAGDMTIPVRITQVELADAQGMSNVHINRTLREIRADGLIRIDSRRLVKVLDYARLAVLGDFDPAYLHLRVMPDMVEGRA